MAVRQPLGRIELPYAGDGLTMSYRLSSIHERVATLLERRAMNLSGKDFFTQEEAAYYCCVSLRKFRDEANAAGIRPVQWGGKLIYCGIDRQRALDREFNKWR